jgi:DNA-binding MarR family transcriptional regulator
MKSLLEITDGNLASHSNALEKAGYIEVKKEFVGRSLKPLIVLPRMGDRLLPIIWMHLKNY